jgi:hypothetical protein
MLYCSIIAIAKTWKQHVYGGIRRYKKSHTHTHTDPQTHTHTLYIVYKKKEILPFATT